MKKFIYPNKENLMYLESLHYTYKEMIKHFEVKVTEDTIQRLFKKYNLHHKSKREYLEYNENLSLQGNAIKNHCSKSTVQRRKK